MKKELIYALSDYEKVKKYDVHTHVNTYDSRFIEMSEHDNFRLLSINLDAPGFPSLGRQQEIAMLHADHYTDHFFHACSFSIDTWEKQNWEKDTIEYLKYALSMGAVAVKVWKNIGMELKDESDNFVMIDHSRFKPVIEFISEQGIPLIGHLGEPRNCWLPLEEMTVSSDRNYFSEHPEYHMYLHPEFPSYEEQISSRDRLLEAYPNLTFVGAHLASLEWNVSELSERLDKYPNMVVDTAERICHLQHQAVTDWQKVRDFFITYQDRIMYGTDIVDDGIKNEDTLVKDITAIRKRHWKFFTSREEMTAPKVTGSFLGLGLPRTVVDKIYCLNAERVFFRQ